jgi:rhodanese-related sulfurtransferase
MQVNEGVGKTREPRTILQPEAGAMTHMLRFALAVIFAIAAATPALPAENWPDSFSAYLASVRKTIKTIDMDGYLSVVKNPDGALLIDVREDYEYKAGHIPGLINIPRGLLEFQIWRTMGYPDKVDMNRKIVVQCRTGGRATLAAADLKAIGFTDVTAVIMNIEQWERSGKPWVQLSATTPGSR